MLYGPYGLRYSPVLRYQASLTKVEQVIDSFEIIVVRTMGPPEARPVIQSGNPSFLRLHPKLAPYDFYKVQHAPIPTMDIMQSQDQIL